MESHQKGDFIWYDEDERPSESDIYSSRILICPTISSRRHSPAELNKYNHECFSK